MSTIRVSDPVDLVKVLPYQLGYHPSDSLALVGLRGRRLEVVQRLELPTEAAAVATAAEVMAGNLVRAGCGTAVVIRYESHAGQGAAAGAELARRLRERGVDVLEHLAVRDSRVYFPECLGSCHPQEGVALPGDGDVPAVAEYVALGANPLPDRQGLATRVAPAEGPVADRVRAAARRLDRVSSPRVLRGRALVDWARLMDAGSPGVAGAPASAAAASRMAVALLDVHVRDLLLAWLCPGTVAATAFDPELLALARAHLTGFARDPDSQPVEHGAGADEDLAALERDRTRLDRLCWLARQVPGELAPGVLTVLGCYAWWLGDGALATVALERALSLDPGYRLAQLVEQLVGLAVRPPRSA